MPAGGKPDWERMVREAAGPKARPPDMEQKKTVGLEEIGIPPAIRSNTASSSIGDTLRPRRGAVDIFYRAWREPPQLFFIIIALYRAIASLACRYRRIPRISHFDDFDLGARRDSAHSARRSLTKLNDGLSILLKKNTSRADSTLEFLGLAVSFRDRELSFTGGRN